MGGTRNGKSQGPIPFPGQQKPADSGTPEQKFAPDAAPVDDELVHRLGSILEEISERSGQARAQQPQQGEQRNVAGRPEPQFKVARPELNLGWLRRCVDNSLDSSQPVVPKQKTWTRWSSRLAPVIALLALLALYPAFRYVLSAAPPDTQTATTVAAQQSARLDAVTPAPNTARPVSVPTIRIVPQQANATAGTAVGPQPVAPPPAAAVVQPFVTQPVARPPAAAVVQPAVPQPAWQPVTRPTVNEPARQRTANANPAFQAQTARAGTVDPADEALLERGRQMMSRGDVAGARLAYSYLADRGIASGALALAESYDPDLLKEIAVVGLAGDRNEAIRYYRRAVDLGSLEAAKRLTQLLAAR